MSALINENKRLFQFRSPMGDKMLCNSFEGTEQLSEIFEYKLELVSEEFNIAWNKMLGKNVTVGIRNLDGKTFRYFNGHISRFSPIRHDGRLAYYSAAMVPWPWFLTLTKDCLVFQNQTAQKIITDTFQKFGFRNFEFELKHPKRHTDWEYCVQYRETALAFVSRMMEIEGMYYYFEHSDGKHKMKIVDDKTSHIPCPQQSEFRYEHNTGAGVVREEATVFSAEMIKVVKPASYFHKEFNFKQPDNPLEYSSNVRSSVHADKQLEVFDYPGEFEQIEEGISWSHVRQLAQECDRIESKGKTNGRSLSPGYRFNIVQHDRKEQDLDYLVTSVSHTAHEGTLLPGSDMGNASYENKYVGIPSAIQYSPMKKTREARVAGSQTATVVGPKGEDIHTDEYGRVRVKFHWDRTSTRDDNSCWIRVMQQWAGNGYGQIWIPRIGQEVIVDFLEGDPDRPIITGCVYNAKNQVPYKLPENKNWSGIKTRSTIGGTAKNYNELRFVDTKEKELFVQHAEKDMHIKVNHNTNETVDNDRFLRVNHDQNEGVVRNKIGWVGNNKVETVSKDKFNTVSGNFQENIRGNMAINVNGQVHEKSKGNFTVESSGDIHLKAGGRITLEAAQGIHFLGKGGYIDITDQVVIEGSRVLINCEGGGFGGFGLPKIPGLGGLSLPDLPGMPDLEGMLNLPGMPDLAGMASMAGMPGGMPGMPSGMPGMPGGMPEGMPGIGVPLTPAEVRESLLENPFVAGFLAETGGHLPAVPDPTGELKKLTKMPSVSDVMEGKAPEPNLYAERKSSSDAPSDVAHRQSTKDAEPKGTTGAEQKGTQGTGMMGLQGTQGMFGLEGAGMKDTGTQGTGMMGLQGTQGMFGTKDTGTQGTGMMGLQGTQGMFGTPNSSQSLGSPQASGMAQPSAGADQGAGADKAREAQQSSSQDSAMEEKRAASSSDSAREAKAPSMSEVTSALPAGADLGAIKMTMPGGMQVPITQLAGGLPAGMDPRQVSVTLPDGNQVALHQMIDALNSMFSGIPGWSSGENEPEPGMNSNADIEEPDVFA